MSNIINFNQAVKEKQDQESGVFAVRDDEGELKDMTEWTGSDWEVLVEDCFATLSASTGIPKWDIFADFMRNVLEVEP